MVATLPWMVAVSVVHPLQMLTLGPVVTEGQADWAEQVKIENRKKETENRKTLIPILLFLFSVFSTTDDIDL